MGNQHAGAAMRQAAADGDFDAVQSIGKHNARACSAPHPKTKATPMHYAAHHGHDNIVKYLYAHGADPNARTAAGNTPLHWAASSRQRKTMKVLVRLGADPTSCGNNGNSPLAWAAYFGMVDLCKLFISCGADVDLADSAGHAPLHWAAVAGHAGICGMLLVHGANPSLPAEDGKTPADLATEHGHSDIAELLTRATWDRSHAKQAITREAETAATESNPLAALLGTPRGDEPRATTPHHHVGRALLASALTPRGTHKRAASSHARHASGGATPAGATATAPVGLDEVNLSVATPGGLGHETDYQRRERSGKNTSQWTDRHAGSFQAGAGRSPRHGNGAESPAHRTVQLLPPPRRASTRHHQDAMQRRHVV